MKDSFHLSHHFLGYPPVAALLLLAGCGPSVSPGLEESQIAVLATTTIFEAENLARTSSAVGTNVSTGDCANSNCAYAQFAGNAASGDYIELTLPNLVAGTHSFVVYYKANNNRGINRVSVDSTNLALTCDEYAAAARSQATCSPGSMVLAAGNHKIRFTVAGKNAASSGYAMTLDKIELTTTPNSGTGGTPGTGGRAGTGGTPGTGGAVGTGGTAGTGGSPGTPLTFEAENLARTSSAIGSAAIADGNASGGRYVQLNAGSAVGDWIALTIPTLAAGSYRFSMTFKSNTNRGIYQANLDGTNFGMPCDEYRAGNAQYNVSCTLGSASFGSGGHTLRFTLAGRNAASSGYTITIDKIIIAPLLQSGSTCSSASQCMSGNCVNGVCCQSASCTSPCQVCSPDNGECTTAMFSDGQPCTGRPGYVCHNGQCNACSPGGVCNPPNVCKTGIYDCSSGIQNCIETGNRPNTTLCRNAFCAYGFLYQPTTCTDGVCGGTSGSACAYGFCHDSATCANGWPLGHDCGESDPCDSSFCRMEDAPPFPYARKCATSCGGLNDHCCDGGVCQLGLNCGDTTGNWRCEQCGGPMQPCCLPPNPSPCTGGRSCGDFGGGTRGCM